MSTGMQDCADIFGMGGRGVSLDLNFLAGLNRASRMNCLNLDLEAQQARRLVGITDASLLEFFSV